MIQVYIQFRHRVKLIARIRLAINALASDDSYFSSGGYVTRARAPRIAVEARLFADTHFIRRANSSRATHAVIPTDVNHKPKCTIM